MFRDNFAVPIGAPHPENAKVFINWMMAPENAAAVSNAIAYSNAIKGDDLLNADWKNNEAINMPSQYADRLRPTVDCNVEARKLRDRIWTKLKG